MEASEKPRVIQLGGRSFTFPSDELQLMNDCNHLLGDFDALHREMEEKGYLLIRGFHDREEVLAAKEAVLEFIASCGDKLDKQHPIREGVLREGCGLGCVPMMEGHNEITHTNSVLAVIEGKRPFNFFKKYFNDDVTTFDYKWLRAMHQEGFTGAHVDNVYMSRGSQDLLTMWTPIGDTPIEMGVLAICEGSHRLPSFDKFQATYGKMDAEKVGLKGTGWFTEDPVEITRKFDGQWKTTDFKAGDVLIFTMRDGLEVVLFEKLHEQYFHRTVHMSTTNVTNLARISCDTRWQPASHPVDPRFCGGFKVSSAKFGLQSKMGSEENTPEIFTTIEKLKEEWGI